MNRSRSPDKPRQDLLALAAGSLLLLNLVSGCSKSPTANTPEPQAKTIQVELFDPKRGIQLPPDLLTTLGVTTTEIRKESIQPQTTVTAHIYRPATTNADPAKALFWSNSGLRQLLTGVRTGHWGPQKLPARILAQAPPAAAPSSPEDTEILVELEDPQATLHVGAAIDITFPATQPIEALTIPASAVIHGPAGPFVYAVNGEHLTRTEVRLGPTSGASVIIEDGLYEGDAVVSHATESLWLIELCAVRGGTPCCPVDRKPGQH